MKRSRWKNIIRNIKGNLNRFLSILFIVALGAGFMAGLAAASPDMYDSADKYIREYDLFDIDIKSVIGLSSDDLSFVSEAEGVQEVMPAKVFDMIFYQDNGSEFTSRVYGVLDENGQTLLNRFHLTEGRLPQNSNECIVETVFGRYSEENVSIGDKLIPDSTGADPLVSSYINDSALTVVGICQSPLCISIEGDSTTIGSGVINLNVYVPESFFSCDFYTDIFLTLEGSGSYNSFDEAYNDHINNFIDSMKPVTSERTQLRIKEYEDEAAGQIKRLDMALDILQKICWIQSELSSMLDQNNSITLETAQILAGSQSDTGSSLSEDLQKTSEMLISYDDTYSPATELLDSVNGAKDSLNEQLSEISGLSWIFRSRKDLAGFDSYSTNVGKVSALAKIFPVFFFIVTLLVALTTMTRLVEENRLQIGTLKALGFSDFQILSEYLLFSAMASILGCILGFLVGFRIFPYAINSAYSMMYILPEMTTPLRWNIIAWVAPVTIISIIIATLWACWNEFRSVPARLMQPKSPPAGKRIWLEHIGFIWHRLSFTYKVTCRNLFRYKKRFIMTIIGVAGCSALLVTGFGIKDSVNDIIDKQFGEIYKYDLAFVLDSPDAVSSDSSLTELLENSPEIISYTCVCQETGDIYYQKDKQEITIFVPENISEIYEYITLRDRKSLSPYYINQDKGVILSEKLCEEMNIRTGDTITLENADGSSGEIIVTAITENYVSSFAYISPEVYYSVFGTSPEYTSLLCSTADVSQTDDTGISLTVSDPDSITSEILANPHVLFGRSVASLKETFSESINSINGVILVLILAAGLLSIVVLYNLTNVNICERRKELATLRVLGFYKNETQRYIFRETNILSFLGSLAGLAVGIWLHNLVVRTVEVNHIMFGREIKPMSFIIALAISMAFTLLVDLIMKRSINSTDMVEAMKAND